MKKNIIITTSAAILAIAAMSFTQMEQPDNKTSTLRKLTNTAFKEGEKIKFRAHYGLIHAANITMSVDAAVSNIGGRNAYSVHCEGETLKSFDWHTKFVINFRVG